MIKKRYIPILIAVVISVFSFGAFNNCSSGGLEGSTVRSSSSSSTATPTPIPASTPLPNPNLISTPTPTPSPSPTPIPVAPNSSLVPAGAILPMASQACPNGWIAADGKTVTRAIYVHLFNAIGTSYGAGNGTTTFTLPDYRGYFLRGADLGASRDPDVGSRSDRGDGSVGDKVGTKQADALRAHNHFIAGGIMYGPNAGGGDTVGGASRVGQGWTENSGGNETRPANISVLYCISTGGQ